MEIKSLGPPNDDNGSWDHHHTCNFYHKHGRTQYVSRMVWCKPNGTVAIDIDFLMIVDGDDTFMGCLQVALIKKQFSRTCCQTNQIQQKLLVDGFCRMCHVNFATKLRTLHEIRQGGNVIQMEATIIIPLMNYCVINTRSMDAGSMASKKGNDAMPACAG